MIEHLSKSEESLPKRFFYLTKTSEAMKGQAYLGLVFYVIKAFALKQVKSKKYFKGKVIAIDGKPANVLQLNINHVFTFEVRAINGVKLLFRTAVENGGLKIFI